MRWIVRCRLFVSSAIRRRRAEMDLEEELHGHLEQETESNRQAGMAEEEARAAARQSLGSLSLYKEECRDARGTAHLASFGRDLRYGWRVLLRNRGFFATAVVALALGIGASATLFSLVEAQLWLPLPFPDSGRLVVIWERNLKAKWQSTPASAADFADWRGRARSFENMAAMGWPERRNFVGNGITDRPQVAAISAGFFETLRASLAAGRTFEAEDEQPGKQTKAIVSDWLAERVFGSAQAALGKTIRLDGQTYSVAGVLAQPFRLEVTRTAEVFVPLAIQGASIYRARRGARQLVVIGRLRSGVSREQALADTAALARAIAAEHPDTNANFSVLVENLRGAFMGESSRIWLLLSFGFSLFVLLIACANVAGLQLMRSLARQREFAIRAALGASRLAMLRQQMAESLWIGIAGALLGSLLAHAGVQALRVAPLGDLLSRETTVSLDFRAVWFVAGVSVAATLLFGLSGASFGAAESVERALREAGRGTSSGLRIRRHIELVAAAQAALAFVSLFGAGLFAASSWDLQRVPLGYTWQDVASVEIPLSGAKYAESQAVRTFYSRAMEQSLHTPGVQDLALASGLPLLGGTDIMFYRADRTRPVHGEEPDAVGRSVTPEYFHLLGIPLVRGRGFSEGDRKESRRVTVINENLARRLFAGEDPIGQRLNILDGGDAAVPAGAAEIVGVAADVRDVGRDEIPFNDIYLPFSQNPMSHMYAVVKSNAVSTVAQVVRRKIQELDKGQFVAEAKPFALTVRDEMRGTRLNLCLVGIFAGLAVLLTGVALYGTLSFVLAQRTREIGIRIALGAGKESIFKLLLQSVWKLAGAGSVGGLAVAMALGSIYRDELYLVPYKHSGLLYGVSIHDPLSLSAAGLVLLAVASVAGVLPALRATRIDPQSTLRCD